MAHTLSIKDLTCQYGSENIIESLSLDVEAGEILCLLGASGCGKTTLLKAISGLVPITQGLVTLNNKILDDHLSNAYLKNGYLNDEGFNSDSNPSKKSQHLAPEQRNIGMIFQDYALFPHLTVAENIAFGLQKSTRQEQAQIVKEMLTLVQLEGYENRYPENLSGGQQQRIAIARSLACKPELLLLDEPFSNIDNQVRHALIREIKDIFKRQQVTAIFVTHSREEAFAFADKLAVMNNGKIEQFGSADELYHRPCNYFVANFLGAGNSFSATHLSNNQFDSVLGNITINSKTITPETINTKIKLNDNHNYQLFIRPQHMLLSSISSQNSDVDTTINNVCLEQVLEVKEIQFMGDFCRYLVEVDQQLIVAMSQEHLVAGDKVKLNVNTQGILVFDC